MKVNLPREFIKLSPISSAIIPRRTPDGHLSKTGYVKLLAFSQVLAVLLVSFSRDDFIYFFSFLSDCYLNFCYTIMKATIFEFF